MKVVILPRNVIKTYLSVGIVFAVLLSVAVRSYAYSRSGEDDFFSYKRFFMQYWVIDKVSGGGRVQADLRKFTKTYNYGINAFSSGELRKARSYFREAGRIWPEFPGTDFLIALTHEREGDWYTAARYYKSYLNKLRDINEGQYRISAPVIRVLLGRDPENSARAHAIIGDHLERYGIDLDKVRPVISVPPFAVFLTACVVLVLAYLAISRILMPYWVRQRRVKNPPEGFWVCAGCGTENPVLRKECEKCGKPQH